MRVFVWRSEESEEPNYHHKIVQTLYGASREGGVDKASSDEKFCDPAGTINKASPADDPFSKVAFVRPQPGVSADNSIVIVLREPA